MIGRLFCAGVVALVAAATAQAQPSTSTYAAGQGFVSGVVVMGLDSSGRAVPCGSAMVSVGCGIAVPPISASSTVIPGTVASANMFQLVIPANPSRDGCLVVNKSTSPLMVFLGLPAAATLATSIMLAPATATSDGGKLSCAIGSGVVLNDPVSLTSTTSGAAFLVIWQ